MTTSKPPQNSNSSNAEGAPPVVVAKPVEPPPIDNFDDFDGDDADNEGSFISHDKRRREDTEMDITPMIDVTFLLLIFFIVASKMDPQKNVDFPTANNGNPVSQRASVVLVVARADAGEGEAEIYKGPSKEPGNLVSGDLIDQEEQIVEYVTEEINRPRKNRVLVLAEKGVHFRHVKRVVNAAGTALDEDQKSQVSVAIKEKQ